MGSRGSRTLCMQLSVNAVSLPDDKLDGYLSGPGGPLTGAQVKAYLGELKNQGYRVVPCNRHKTEKDGTCTSVPI